VQAEEQAQKVQKLQYKAYSKSIRYRLAGRGYTHKLNNMNNDQQGQTEQRQTKYKQ